MADRTRLRQQIDNRFNEEDLRSLCFDLGFEYENLGGRGKSANVRELIRYCQQHNLLLQLQTHLLQLHPKVAWDTIFTVQESTADKLYKIFPLNHIPFHRNNAFTGRENWLTDIHNHLSINQTTAVTKIISGLGGVGKTQMALAYCYQHLNDYDLIYWFQSDDSVLLASDMAQLAYTLRLVARENNDQATAIAAALRWLENTPRRWLLIYDNADQIHPTELHLYRPKRGNGGCLITSRNANWGTIPTLHLDVFTPDEANDFLHNRLGLNGNWKSEMDNEPLPISQLINQLGHFPLALEHAAAYINETGCSVADYLTYYEEERQELWAEVTPPDAYHATIATTWEMAFQKIRIQNEAAIDLLNLCCFFAPQAIPLTLLTNHSDQFPPPLRQATENKRKLDQSIVALRHYSLLTRDGNMLSLHRLVQTIARDRMNTKDRKIWANIAIDVLAATYYFDKYNMDTWAESESLLPHIQTVCTHSKQLELSNKNESSLNDKAGYYLQQNGNLKAARPLYERALAIREKTLGSEHPDTALSLNHLGFLMKAIGDYEKARLFYERSLAIREKVLATNHPDTAQSLNNLAVLRRAMGDYEGALLLYKRALIIREIVLERNHPDISQSLNNLGFLLQKMGDYAAALPLYERALTIREQVLGFDHPTTARSLNNLGSLFQAMGDHKKARILHEQALIIKQKTLNPSHPTIAQSLNNLGLMHQSMGDYEKARAFFKHALSIREKVLGLDHPDTAESLENLGYLLQTIKDYKEAQIYFHRALSIMEKALGYNHPDTAFCLNKLAGLLYTIGDVQEAALLIKRAVNIFDRTIPNHPNTQTARDLLSIIEIQLK